ncbi:hypothetical protein [Nocardiopsis protaetiae]|uniref:hypothetical protein n=1 Tax=Nocardiopsis protaetiae TaxID=3382270 RepID=UPI00387AD780
MRQQHIVEGFWFNDRLYIWALDTTPSAAAHHRRVPLHPRALPPEDLGPCAGGLGSDEPCVAVLHLPDLPGGDPAPHPWSVPVRELGPAAALRLLSGPAGSTAGAGLRHLAAFARAAHDHARAGCVVPAVHHGDRIGVRWRPVLAPAGLAWLRNAAAAAPPPLRAHRRPDPDPSRSGAAVVADLLECLCSLTDAAVRERLADRFPDGGADLPAAAAPTREWFVRAHRAAAGERCVVRPVRALRRNALVEPGGRR